MKLRSEGVVGAEEGGAVFSNQRWGLWLSLALPVVALLYLTRDAVGDLAHLWWTHGSYGHGLLVVPISLYLIWTRRAFLLREARPEWLAVAFVLGASGVWLAARVTDVMVGEQIGVLFMLWGISWVVLGRGVAWRLAFPLGYLVFAIPVWEVLIPVLRDDTAAVTAWAVRALGVPVFVEGRMLYIPEGTFEIADVCAGLRFFLAALCISSLYAFLTYRRFWLAASFVAIGVAWAILFNWLRVICIVMTGHVAGMTHPLVQDHNTFGWILFAVAMVPLFLFGEWYRRWDRSEPDLRLTREYRPAARDGKLIAASALAIVAISSGPATAYWAARSPEGVVAEQVDLARLSQGWESVEGPEHELSPSFAGASFEGSRRYRNESGAAVSLYVARYVHQRQGAELINDFNQVYDAERWILKQENAIEVLNPHAPVPVRELLLEDRRGTGRLVWYWYDVAEQFTSNQYVGKLLQLRALLRQAPFASAIVVSTEATGGLESARSRLEAFMAANLPELSDRIRAGQARETER